MFTQFQEFKGLQFLNIVDDVQDSFADPDQPFSNSGKNVQLPTNIGGNTAEQEVSSRSLKNRKQTGEISFEASFLDEHTEALRKQTQNFMESALENQNKKGMGFNNPELFGQEMNTSPLNLSRMAILAPGDLKQFTKDLENQDHLSSFLHSLDQQYPLKVVEELVYIAFLTWEKHIEVRKAYVSQSSILKIAAQFAEEVAQREFAGVSLRFLNLAEAKQQHLKPENQIRQAFEEFLKFYCSTVFLVIEGFFENPYAEGSASNKRERSENEIDWDCEFLETVSEIYLRTSVKKFKLQ